MIQTRLLPALVAAVLLMGSACSKESRDSLSTGTEPVSGVFVGGGPQQQALLRRITTRTLPPQGVTLRLTHPDAATVATDDNRVAVAATIRAPDSMSAARGAWYAALIVGAFNDASPSDRSPVALRIIYRIGRRAAIDGGTHPLAGRSRFPRANSITASVIRDRLESNVRSLGGSISSMRLSRPLRPALAVTVTLAGNDFLAHQPTQLAVLQHGLIDPDKPLLDGLFLEIRDSRTGKLVHSSGYATRLGLGFGWTPPDK